MGWELQAPLAFTSTEMAGLEVLSSVGYRQVLLHPLSLLDSLQLPGSPTTLSQQDRDLLHCSNALQSGKASILLQQLP